MLGAGPAQPGTVGTTVKRGSGLNTVPRHATMRPDPMSNSGAITLGDLRGQFAMLDVACRKCARHGRYKVAGLIAHHGADANLPDLREVLAADCPRMKSGSLSDQCGVYYPRLPERG
jgi:hypothetical protein